jgi:hypothetical protein
MKAAGYVRRRTDHERTRSECRGALLNPERTVPVPQRSHNQPLLISTDQVHLLAPFGVFTGDANVYPFPTIRSFDTAQLLVVGEY